jgi:prolipoprotein diacylglyceryltransferase
LLILWAVWPASGWIRTRIPGVRFLGFIALSSTAQLLIEGLRGDSLLTTGGLRTVQIFAWVTLALAMGGLGKLRSRAGQQEETNDQFLRR